MYALPASSRRPLTSGLLICFVISAAAIFFPTQPSFQAYAAVQQQEQPEQQSPEAKAKAAEAAAQKAAQKAAEARAAAAEAAAKAAQARAEAAQAAAKAAAEKAAQLKAAQSDQSVTRATASVETAAVDSAAVTGVGSTAADSLDAETVAANLRAFAKLYGYVRYFHPSDRASAIDWDRFALHGARQVKDAASQNALRARLEALFLPIAPTVQIYASDAPPPAQPAALIPADTVGLNLVAWQHRGVDLGNPRSPFRSIRLHRVKDRADAGSVSRGIRATPFRGQEVQLRAAVKTSVRGRGNQAQLWLRIGRPGQQLRYDMKDQPITASGWQVYEVTGTVPEDARSLFFGGLLEGRGTAWFDDFQLFSRKSAEEPWSRVRFGNGGFEAGVPGDAPPEWDSQSPGYQSANVTGDAHAGAQALMLESFKGLFDKYPEAGEVVDEPLGRGLAARVPLALYSKDGQTLRPQAAPITDSLAVALDSIRLDDRTAEDPSLRFADVVIAWNVFQHFYPYFDVVEADWDAVLTRTLRRTVTDESEADFLQTLQHMVAALGDGQGRVMHPLTHQGSGLPFRVEQAEGQIVISAVAEAGGRATCPKRGDVVVSMEGVAAKEMLQNDLQRLSGSPQWKTYQALRQFGRGERGTAVSLTLRRDGQPVTCQAMRTFDEQIQYDRPAPFDEIRPGIHYVDLNLVKMDAIRQKIDQLAQAQGVIFDLRGYPNGNHEVLRYLTDRPMRSARWQKPHAIYPDQKHRVGYDTTGRWKLLPQTPQFTGKAVFLTDARATSYAESIMGIVEHYKLGEIVGQPTAGANGSANPFSLPGGYRISWTGMRVLKHDGSQHHLTGIRPTVPVERTLEGLRAGRDEYLTQAISLIEAAGETADLAPSSTKK